MAFSYEIMDKVQAIANAQAAGDVPEKLLNAQEPKVVALTYTTPLSRTEKLMLAQFEKGSFYREMLKPFKIQRADRSNVLITVPEAELGRIETEIQTTILFHGRTGVLNAISNAGMVMDRHKVDQDIAEIAASVAGVGGNGGAPAARAKSQHRR